MAVELLQAATLKSDSIQSASLANVIARIEALQSLTPGRRRQLHWAVRFLARLLGKEPHELPADVNFIRDAMRNYTPEFGGRTPTRWASIISAARAALIVSGYIQDGRPERPRLSPTWQQLRVQIRNSRLARDLPCLMRYCSARNIGP